ncbi:MAG: dTDP-4-dehydrorhamnose 3,5-epimerase family protein [Nitrososphaerota archaeon]|nr:dTDP-4-dehydrorhamnose 3,5-epimerase family protein [Aigarchaeota archaeon]MDW8076195.1 dTDP-4-dehydrorhamnose 3,5-epimerase family protein [Nitrososphaerota archaeon]
MMLPGIKIKDINKLPDERGFFAELLRDDWQDLLEGDRIVQANVSLTYPGVIRAWHRHSRGQVDYFVVLRGALKIVAYDDDEGSPTRGQLCELVLSYERFQLLRIPGHYWHGFKAIAPEPTLTLYFTNRLYDYSKPDEERRPWNDQRIIDPRTGKPYDWNAPPHR